MSDKCLFCMIHRYKLIILILIQNLHGALAYITFFVYQHLLFVQNSVYYNDNNNMYNNNSKRSNSGEFCLIFRL